MRNGCAERRRTEAMRDLAFDLVELAYPEHDWLGLQRPDQAAPHDPDWAIWLLLGGRGSGKTRTGAEWVLEQVRLGARRVAIVAPTLHDAREVMLGGDSGLLRAGFRDHRPVYEPTRRRLLFPNGAVGHIFSAHDPDSLRGPQFDCAWGDEFCAWPDPDAVLSNLRLGLRLERTSGEPPRLCLTTTPRPIPALDRLMAQGGTRVTRSRTVDNAAHLAPGFVQAMRDTYDGSALGRQELDGEVVRDHPGAIFKRADIDAHRVDTAPDLDRVIVALDPSTTDKAGSDACGLVVVGVRDEDAYVLQDATLKAAPQVWAAEAIRLYHLFEADCILSETNQGGDMVATLIHQIDPDIPVESRHARHAKARRAMPVGLLYARGRVHHVGDLSALEDELCAFGGPHGRGSPDRLDALVWGVSELLLGQAAPRLYFL